MSLTPFVYLDTPLDTLTAGVSLAVGDATRKHLSTVLRLKPGADVQVSDGQGRTARAVLDAGGMLTLTGTPDVEPPDRVAVTLAQGVPKLRKLDTVVRLATEAGVAAVLPVVTARSPVTLGDVALAKHEARLAQLRSAAGEQARRPYQLTLQHPVGFDMLCETHRQQPWLLCDSDGDAVHTAVAELAGTVQATGTVTVVVGPEGGFTPEEKAFARACGARVIRLSSSVLRSEHAGLYAVAAVRAVLDQSV